MLINILQINVWSFEVVSFNFWLHVASLYSSHIVHVSSFVLPSLSGGRGPGSGRDWCVEDRGRVPAPLVQWCQQHGDARLRLSAHMGLVNSRSNVFELLLLPETSYWYCFYDEMDGRNESVPQLIWGFIHQLYVLLPPREPQRCVCWCWLQRHPSLSLLGCC